MTTIADIARATGVSTATVSNALSGRGRVSSKKAEEINAAVARMGYVPQHAARALRKGKTSIIGLVVPNITNPIFTAMAQAIDECLHECGYGVLLADSKNRRKGQNEALRNLTARGADALILIPRHDTEIIKTGIPIVVIDVPEKFNNAIGSDHIEGGRLIADHLANLGHRNILIMAGPSNSNVAKARLAGMVEVFDRVADLQYKILHSAYGPDVVDEILPSIESGKYTAVAAVSDTLAVGALRYFNRKRIKVPDEISVSGFDDTIWTELSTPTITTIHQDVQEIARRATAIATDATGATGDVATDFTVPVNLVIRNSTGPCPPLLARPRVRDTIQTF